jgi:hypothetical protein
MTEKASNSCSSSSKNKLERLFTFELSGHEKASEQFTRRMLIREKAVRNLEETVVNNSTIYYELLVLLLHFTLANRTASIHIGRADWFCGNARCKVS